MEWHPFAARFPMIEGEEWEAFKESIRTTNGNEIAICFRTLHGKKQYIDGRNRLKACDELNLACREQEVILDDSEVIDFILRRNMHRRHLNRKQRQEIVRALRKEGFSIREIAEKTNSTPTTVRRDLASGGPNGTPGKITGKDGKTYTARKVILCERCARVGARDGCNACKTARKEAAKKKADAKRAESLASVNGHCDHFGNPLPKKCLVAMEDPWLQASLEKLAKMHEDVRKSRFLDGMEKRKGLFPFVNTKDTKDGLGFVSQYLNQVVKHLSENRPAGVCRHCEGAGCGECRNSGLVPRNVYLEQKKVTA